MSQKGSSTSLEHERQRLERICAALVEAFEAHPETRDADRCAIKLENQRGIVIDDYDDPGELWTARRLAADYAVGVHFIYAPADELGVIRLGLDHRRACGSTRRLWASVNALPPVARSRRRPAHNEGACRAPCRASGVRARRLMATPGKSRSLESLNAWLRPGCRSHWEATVMPAGSPRRSPMPMACQPSRRHLDARCNAD